MQQAIIGEILDGTIRRESPHYHLYLVRDGEVVFYIGQASSIYDRLETHLGIGDWGKQASRLGRLVSGNLPESRDWVIELYSLEDCEQLTIGHMVDIGVVWFNEELYYNAGGGVDFAEQSLIALHHPCLNTTYNPDPNLLPERYWNK